MQMYGDFGEFHFPYPFWSECMAYLPTLGRNWPHSRENVGKYSLHGRSWKRGYIFLLAIQSVFPLAYYSIDSCCCCGNRWDLNFVSSIFLWTWRLKVANWLGMKWVKWNFPPKKSAEFEGKDWNRKILLGLVQWCGIFNVSWSFDSLKLKY